MVYVKYFISKDLGIPFTHQDQESLQNLHLILMIRKFGMGRSKNDNEELEKQLYLAEAQINAQYHQYGFDMTSMIVESGDHLFVQIITKYLSS